MILKWKPRSLGCSQSSELVESGDSRMKSEFNQFFGFLRSWRPLPPSYCIDCGACQQRTAAEHLRGLHRAVRCNRGLYLDGSAQLEPAGQIWIDCHHFVHDLPILMRLCVRESWGEDDHPHKERQERSCNPALHE